MVGVARLARWLPTSRATISICRSDVRAYMIAGTPHFSEAGERDAQCADDGAAGQSDACGPADARAGHGDARLDHRGQSSRPRAACRCAPMARWWKHRTPCRAAFRACPIPPFTPSRPSPIRRELPAKILGSYPVFVPRADSDGMAIAGIRMLPLAVPRASYTGWNPRAEGFGAGTLVSVAGRGGAVCRSPAPPARRRAIRASPSRSATRMMRPMSPRCDHRQRGWWPNGCCCRRMPNAPSRLRRRTNCLS